MRLILFLCLAVGASAETNICDNGLGDWLRDTNSPIGVYYATNSRIVQLPNGKFQPQFNMQTNGLGWTPLFEADKSYDDLGTAQRKLRWAWLIDKEIKDGLIQAFKSAYPKKEPSKPTGLTNMVAHTPSRPEDFGFRAANITNSSTPIRWLESPVTVPILNYKKNQGWETPSHMRWSPTEDVILGLREDGVVVWKERVQTNYTSVIITGITNEQPKR